MHMSSVSFTSDANKYSEQMVDVLAIRERVRDELSHPRNDTKQTTQG